MKSISFKIVALATVLITSSCEKNNVKDEMTDHSMMSETAKISKKKWGLCCVWNGVDKCVKPKVNCFAEVIITGLQAYNDLISASNGTSESTSQYFNSDAWRNIFPDLDVDEGEYSDNIKYLNKLQSGNYALIYQTEGDITYFFAGDPDNLTFDNFEFVLQVNTSEL
ncbi:MAG TPA: hypothetical protein PKN14_00875 [Bacteroidia bacterium]|nr:MAG: hypothetical protein UZ10_BCD003002011 [Bacteroidetes bacterium OLB10]MBX3107052.1 hypothetical protein [Bacteroidota bacterium]MCB8930779.1 hypothetical protein [Bacteroidia bacterium]MCE7954682.1 hypothetical protein [Bacteroidetes bacterium CHB6]OQB61833.1 MAG: hypothetical protein BWX95_01630 [Bacteroidetes bacterium ADurb.Bin141]